MKKTLVVIQTILIVFFLSGYSLAKEYKGNKIPPDDILAASYNYLIRLDLPANLNYAVVDKVVGKYQVSKNNYFVFFKTLGQSIKGYSLIKCSLFKLDSNLWVLNKDIVDVLVLTDPQSVSKTKKSVYN